MINRFTFLIVLLSSTYARFDVYARLNVSLFLYPIIADEIRPQPSPFLKEVLKAISIRHKWNETTGVKVSKLDLTNAKFGHHRRYDIRLRVGKGEISFRLRNEVSSWKKLKNGGDFETSVRQISSKSVLEKFLLRGPLELLVNGSNLLSLHLPLNVTHTGLKRLIVGEDIMVEVRNAKEVTLFHSLQQGFHSNQSSGERTHFWPFEHESCSPLFPVHISGPASVIDYKSRNPNANIQTIFLSKDTIELLPPETCYIRNRIRNQRFPIDSLKPRIAIIEKLMRTFFSNNGAEQNRIRTSLKVKINASPVIRFKINLEKDLKESNNLESTMEEWRTKPKVERVCYEVTAVMEEDRLIPLTLKRSRPFIEVDTYAWNDLLLNISFTKFPSLLVPPEPLTLDVKW